MSSRKCWVGAPGELERTFVYFAILRSRCCEGDGDKEREKEDCEAWIHGGWWPGYAYGGDGEALK